MLSIERAQDGHTLHVGANLRQADRNEIAASVGLTDETVQGWVLLEMVRISAGAWNILDDGEAVAVLGVSNEGLIWMVGTPKLIRQRREFLRGSKRFLKALKDLGFTRIFNHVDERNTTHIRWLKWLGASFSGRWEYRHDPNIKFLEFSLCVSS